MLLSRAFGAFLALPTMVAGVVPAWMIYGQPPRAGAWPLAAVALLAGVSLLVWCVRDFFVIGRGTLAPWDPPRHLVVIGLYRWVRNPMYLAVLLIVAGWTLLYRSPWLLAYLLGLATAFHLRVCHNEEPRLRRRFGAEWDHYAASVPRWLPRRPRPSK